jgi:uncharacterized membrane protein
MLTRHPSATDRARNAARLLLGGTLAFAGTSHLTFARREFRSQVPETVAKLSPLSVDQIVLASGVAEIALGATIALAPERHRRLVGDVAAVFFAAVFPGNLAQWQHHRDAFGLDTDGKRALRLLGQPGLIAWALWSTRDAR